MEDLNDIKVIKKDGTLENFDPTKIIKAVHKSASRVMIKLSAEDDKKIISKVQKGMANSNLKEVPISKMHLFVESALDKLNKDIAKSYRDYRNYKVDFVGMLDDVYKESQRIMYIGDKENSNTDSALVSTRRSLIYNQLNKELYKKFFLTVEELQAVHDGYIYIHDMSARRDTMNCCLCDVGNVMKNGFEMGNIWYNEPKSLDVAFDVIGDIVLSTAAQQYGGFTVPEIDKILAPYAQKSYNTYYTELIGYGLTKEFAEQEALKKVEKDFKQGWQGLEYKFNTVGSSRGDYPFITVTLGLGTEIFEKMCTLQCLNVRMNGQGKEGRKRPVLFPKIVFLYDKNLHGVNKVNEDLFEKGIECSSKTMYPDWLSLTGEGYISSMYKKYGRVISPMGCVDGEETISYKLNGEYFTESFKRAWERISKTSVPKGQNFNEDKNLIIDTSNFMEIFDSKVGFTPVKSMIRNIQKNWCNITLSNGRTVKVTTDHPFETENRGVVLAKDLTIEDEISICVTKPNLETETSITAELSWLLGVAICDGWYTKDTAFISLGLDENDIKDKIISVLNNFKIPTIVKEHRRGTKGNYQDIRIPSNTTMTLRKIYDFLMKMFEGKQKKYRHLSSEIFNFPKELKYSFLAGMIDADGYINNSKIGRNPKIQIGSTNKELALQQLELALSLGLKSHIYINHYNSKNVSKIRYRVEISPDLELIKYITSQKKKNHYFEFEKIDGKKIGKVTKIEILPEENQFSYDVCTESEHFTFSGIYSHNCRAFLSPWYEKGGVEPADENDKPVFVGRFNIGAVSLHLPMILAKARKESKDFYEVLDYYLEMIRGIHKRTYDYLGEMRASTNPIGYCQGGFYGGNLQPHEKIKSILKPMTASFGITALNELQELYNGKSIREDGKFALEVMQYINNKVAQFKKEDGWLYAIYGTPAENLCGLQIKQFRKIYGIVENVSDKPYVSNSFHCHVSEDMSPIEKQDKEGRFWEMLNGGKIQYVKYPIDYNITAIKALVRRAMDLGFYEGVNLSLAYCEDCGHQELAMDVCPKCGSKNLTKIERMNGYLSYSRVAGDTRLNEAKMAEIKDRKSM